MGDLKSTMIAITCKSRMADMPYTKYQCLVLWRKTCMPRMEPRLPPIIAIIKRVDSGILQSLLMALRLSMPIIANPKRFTTAKYPAMMLITTIMFLFSCVRALSETHFSEKCLRCAANVFPKAQLHHE